jgi:hypothetical protein
VDTRGQTTVLGGSTTASAILQRRGLVKEILTDDQLLDPELLHRVDGCSLFSLCHLAVREDVLSVLCSLHETTHSSSVRHGNSSKQAMGRFRGVDVGLWACWRVFPVCMQCPWRLETRCPICSSVSVRPYNPLHPVVEIRPVVPLAS